MGRSLLIDTVKAVASQLIVLHHLSLYAPMADWLATAWPGFMAFLHQEGRLAVQPFLVVGGFLTVHSLHQRHLHSPLPLVWQRYLRLLPQFLVALVLVVLATWLMGQELAHEDWVSPLPTAGVLIAHVLFLQDVLGIPSLTAGAWYLAIDLQLFALFAVLAWFTARLDAPLANRVAPAVVAVATAVWLLLFSRRPALDEWAIYHLAAYGLGALAAWARLHPPARAWWWAALALVLVDASWDPRPRPLLAMATALALFAGSHLRWTAVSMPLRRAIAHLSDMSYSIFVCHFAVILLASGLWNRLDLHGVGPALAWSAFAWALSIGVGVAVQRLCDRWMLRGRAPALSAAR
jgi:peptidoglycan/LPS O-acetylase OafA/YrhL